jgi:hypothetical protein
LSAARKASIARKTLLDAMKHVMGVSPIVTFERCDGPNHLLLSTNDGTRSATAIVADLNGDVAWSEPCTFDGKRLAAWVSKWRGDDTPVHLTVGIGKHPKLGAQVGEGTSTFAMADPLLMPPPRPTESWATGGCKVAIGSIGLAADLPDATRQGFTGVKLHRVGDKMMRADGSDGNAAARVLLGVEEEWGSPPPTARWLIPEAEAARVMGGTVLRWGERGFEVQSGWYTWRTTALDDTLPESMNAIFPGGDPVPGFDFERPEQSIIADRDELLEHIERMLSVHTGKSSYQRWDVDIYPGQTGELRAVGHTRPGDEGAAVTERIPCTVGFDRELRISFSASSIRTLLRGFPPGAVTLDMYGLRAPLHIQSQTVEAVLMPMTRHVVSE